MESSFPLESCTEGGEGSEPGHPTLTLRGTLHCPPLPPQDLESRLCIGRPGRDKKPLSPPPAPPEVMDSFVSGMSLISAATADGKFFLR